MTSQEALQNLNTLIEQTVANGLFKKLQDLDIVRQSFQVVSDQLQETEMLRERIHKYEKTLTSKNDTDT